MNKLNSIIDKYQGLIKQGEIQTAYKGILDFVGKLRTDFIRKYPEYDVSGVYQGYMDMSYFSLSSTRMKSLGLKIAIVYLHEKGTFEAWLSARNRDIAKRYSSIMSGHDSSFFHDAENQDAIVECTLVVKPDFDNQDSLVQNILKETDKFVTTIAQRLDF